MFHCGTGQIRGQTIKFANSPPWEKALVWFDDVDVSTFHSYVVVDLCRRENVGA